MKLIMENWKKLLEEELEKLEEIEPDQEVDWKARSLSIVTMLANINSSLAATNSLLEQQSRLLRQIAQNTESRT